MYVYYLHIQTYWVYMYAYIIIINKCKITRKKYRSISGLFSHVIEHFSFNPIFAMWSVSISGRVVTKVMFLSKK